MSDTAENHALLCPTIYQVRALLDWWAPVLLAPFVRRYIEDVICCDLVDIVVDHVRRGDFDWSELFYDTGYTLAVIEDFWDGDRREYESGGQL